jgi:hypothetical protein
MTDLPLFDPPLARCAACRFWQPHCFESGRCYFWQVRTERDEQCDQFAARTERVVSDHAVSNIPRQ